MKESLKRSQTGGDIYQKAKILQMQSRTFSRQGRMDQAEEKVREALKINEKGEKIQYAKDLIVLTDILLDLDRIDEAEQSQSKSDNLFKKDCGKPEYQAVSHMYLGWIRFKQHRYAEAVKVFNEAIEVFEKENSKKNTAESKRGLAEVDLIRNDLDGAEKKLKEARDLLKEEHDFEDRYKIDMVMAKLLDKKGVQGKAVDVLEKIIKEASRQRYGFLVKSARDYLKSLSIPA